METIDLEGASSSQKQLSSVQKEKGHVDEEQYWESYYEHPLVTYEWNNGQLEEIAMADYLSIDLYRWFFTLLNEYLKSFPIGRMMALEMGFRLNLGEKITVRKPDLAIICYMNPVKTEPHDRSFLGVCDVCIEFLSDSTPQEVERDTVIKKNEYEAVGVKEYYLLDRHGKHTAFYQLDDQGHYQTMDPEGKGTIRSKVMESFAFRMSDLENQIDFEALMDHPIYQPFLLKSLQQAHQREKQALLEKEQALSEVEHLRALLRK